MASRFCHPFLFSVLLVALVLTAGEATAEPKFGFLNHCIGLCSGGLPQCKSDCAKMGFKDALCIDKININECCCQ
ncbi:uncharacterized protein HKW66_Vig0245480 [Vigna angularis]|uniref:Knottin scorpion toxin-like domain-containing protein n=1 Tax=Phaseolus angularis TaxID=3914 RepID=A0A8T0KZV1_PHAAN|nr:uncharacterized protein HKW66_Vig0245480 [Vigna angularis]